jgi:hypothetical protein
MSGMRRRALGWIVALWLGGSGVAFAQGTTTPEPVVAPTPIAAPAASASAAPTSAAPPRGQYTHDGFYLRYALGGAFWQLTGTWQVVGTGPSGHFRESGAGVGEILAIGGTLPSGLVIAGAASALVSNRSIMGTYGVLVDWFPQVRGGWHVGGLLGLGVQRTTVAFTLSTGPGSSLAFDPLTDTIGLGATLLGGYDFWVTPQCSVGIMALVATMTTTAANQDSVGEGLVPVWAGLLASVLYH